CPLKEILFQSNFVSWLQSSNKLRAYNDVHGYASKNSPAKLLTNSPEAPRLFPKRQPQIFRPDLSQTCDLREVLIESPVHPCDPVVNAFCRHLIRVSLACTQRRPPSQILSTPHFPDFPAKSMNRIRK